MYTILMVLIAGEMQVCYEYSGRRLRGVVFLKKVGM